MLKLENIDVSEVKEKTSVWPQIDLTEASLSRAPVTRGGNQMGKFNFSMIPK